MRLSGDASPSGPHQESCPKRSGVGPFRASQAVRVPRGAQRGLDTFRASQGVRVPRGAQRGLQGLARSSSPTEAEPRLQGRAGTCRCPGGCRPAATKDGPLDSTTSCEALKVPAPTPPAAPHRTPGGEGAGWGPSGPPRSSSPRGAEGPQRGPSGPRKEFVPNRGRASTARKGWDLSVSGCRPTAQEGWTAG